MNTLFVSKEEIVMEEEAALFWYNEADYDFWICYKSTSHLIHFMLKITFFLRAIPLKKIRGDIQKNTENKNAIKHNDILRLQCECYMGGGQQWGDPGN